MGWYEDATFGYRSESPLPYIKQAKPSRRDRITELRSTSQVFSNEKRNFIKQESTHLPTEQAPILPQINGRNEPPKTRSSNLTNGEKAHRIEQEASQLPNEHASVLPGVETEHRSSGNHSRKHTPESERRHRVHREGYYAARRDSKHFDGGKGDVHVRYLETDEMNRHEDVDPLIAKTTPAKESRTSDEKHGRKVHHSRRRKSPYPSKE
jgi:hypothetical protein